MKQRPLKEEKKTCSKTLDSTKGVRLKGPLEYINNFTLAEEKVISSNI